MKYMYVEHHDLAKEFPEFKENISQLKQTDAHFARLFSEYQDLDKEICRLETEDVPVTDEAFEAKKKQRLQLKDDLYAILKNASKTCCGSCG
jgi:uncharacterized protein YdcH (DUF465 family)